MGFILNSKISSSLWDVQIVLQTSKVFVGRTSKEYFVPITVTLLDKNMLCILFKMKMV